MAHVKLKDVSKSYPDGTVAVESLNLEITAGEFLCVLGPSGCGKSSTLRMIAGLEEVTSGIIELDGQNVVGVPARDRDIAMVFENYALYPHLSVFNNIAMPLVARRTGQKEIHQRVTSIAETLEIVEHLQKRPAKLSGGQRQRVALARAMIRSPRMFLMDEPLGHLEAYLRVELRREIRTLHEATGGTTFYITHDQEEAAAVADRIAVMSAGVLQQVGTMRDLIDRPHNRLVAEFVGEPPISIFENIDVKEDALQLGDFSIGLTDDLLAACLKHRPVSVGVRPGNFTISNADAEGVSGTVKSVQPMGEWSVVLCDTHLGAANVVVPVSHRPAEGSNVRLMPDSGHLHVFARDGRNIVLLER